MKSSYPKLFLVGFIIILIYLGSVLRHVECEGLSPKGSYKNSKNAFTNLPKDEISVNGCVGLNGEMYLLQGKSVWKDINGVRSLVVGSGIGTVYSCDVDSNGDVYVGDDNTIRKIFSNGTMIKIAGNEVTLVALSFVDNGTALNTPLGTVNALKVAANGDVYFLEKSFHILRVVRKGIVSLVAGYPGEKGEVNNVIAKSGRFNLPEDLLIDKETGDILICDSGNNAVRVISATTGIIGTKFGVLGLTMTFTVTSVVGPTSIYKAKNGDYYVACGVSSFTFGKGILKILNGNTDVVPVLGFSTVKTENYYSENGKNALATDLALTAAPKFLIPNETSGEIYFFNKGLCKVQDGRVKWIEESFNTPRACTSETYPRYVKLLNENTMLVSTNVGLTKYNVDSPLARGENYLAVVLNSMYGEDIAVQSASSSERVMFKVYDDEILLANSNSLRRIDLSTDTINTLAGLGSYQTIDSSTDYGGDGGPAKKAKIQSASSPVRLPSGDILFITNNRLRIIRDKTGIIEHYAGSLTGSILNCPTPEGTHRLLACFGTILAIEVHPITNTILVGLNIDSSFVVKSIENDVVYTYLGNSSKTCTDQCGDGLDKSNFLSPSADYVEIKIMPNGEFYLLLVFGSNCRIRKIGLDGKLSTIVGYVSGEKTLGAQSNNFVPSNRTFISCYSMDIATNGDMYLAMSQGSVVRKSSTSYDKNEKQSKNNDPRFLQIFGKAGFYEYSDPLTFGIVYVSNVFKTKKGDIYAISIGFIVKIDAETGLMYSVVGMSTMNTFTQNVGFSYDYVMNGLWVNDNGEIYFTDSNHLVRKVTEESFVEIIDIAGTYKKTCASPTSSCGDGGLASNALLNKPAGIFIHNDGSIYFSDSGNNKIRKILTNGTIITVAGTGVACKDPTSACGDGGPATNAMLNVPNSLYIKDNGDIYFTDTYNHKIRLITASTGIISTIAGNGKTATDSIKCNNGGSPTNSSLYYPVGLTLAEDGTIIFADQGSSHIRYISSDRSTVNALVGSYANQVYLKDPYGEGLSNVKFTTPKAVFLTGNELLYTDWKEGSVRTITATCPPGYYGFACTPICFDIYATNSSVCSGHGKCVEYNSCQCIDNYFGNFCELTSCNGIQSNSSEVCSGHGTCKDYNTCTCDATRFGTNCEKSRCFGINSDVPNVCGSHGVCKDVDTCSCDPHYYGPECKVTICGPTFSNETNVCNNRGTCNSYDTCVCKAGYFGKYCENSYCFGVQSNSSSVCSSHGTCYDSNLCKCDSGFAGTDCSKTSCFGILNTQSNVCSGKGSCISVDTCKCNTGYGGENCAIPSCFGVLSNSSMVCSQNGQCTGPNTCVCKANRYGADCSIKKCFGTNSDSSKVCSGNGTCIELDTCECKENYVGRDCSIPVCYSTFANQSTVCSGKGKCMAANSCSCQPQYYGEKCENFYCNSKLFNDSNVCSGLGKCSSPEKCICNEGYGGENCQYPLCYGILSNSSNVCNGNGKCVGKDKCECGISNNGQVFYNGTQCQNLYCYSYSAKDSNVCSGRGTCTLDSKTMTGGCKCNAQYSGDTCEMFSCSGIPKTDPKVCNGKGSCVAHDQCVCKQNLQDGFWGGLNCSSCLPDYATVATGCKSPNCDPVRTCYNHGTCNATQQCECAGNWDGTYCSYCKPNYYGVSCNKYCSPQVTCSSRGSCLVQNGTCSCFSSWQTGYYTGDACDKCENGYTGKECSTKIIAPIRFLNDLTGIRFTFYGPFYYSSDNVDCNTLVHASYVTKLGSNPSCYWVDKKSGDFRIIFGTDSTLKPNEYLKLNRLVFDAQTDYIALQVLMADSPIRPTAQIISSDKIGLCDTIILDGSGSYSTDFKPLKYHWSVLASPNGNLSSLVIPDASRVEISSSIAGSYQFSLIVESSQYGIMSNPANFSVDKSSAPLPFVSIVDLSASVFYSTSVVLLKKLITVPACYYPDTSMNVVWTQLSGPAVDMVTDANDNLMIRKFLTKGDQIYSFKVSVVSKVNAASTAFATVSISTMSKPLSLSTYFSTVSTASAEIIATYSDPEGLAGAENWLWSCTDSGLGCNQAIVNSLKSYSISKTSTISIPLDGYSTTQPKPTLRISLQITKESRNVTSFVEFVVPGEGISPPTINLISLSPQKAYMLNSDIISIDMDVTANNQRSDIDQYITREWRLNSVLLTQSNVVLDKMSKSPALSNSLVINAAKLSEGTTYIVELTVRDSRITQQATYSTSFTMATTPKSCPCSVTPATGYVFDTAFSFACSNCQNSAQSIKITYGFIDDKTSVEMSLYTGVQSYQTKLPCTTIPTTIPLSVFFKITDTNSGAFIMQKSTIQVLVPTVATYAIASRKISEWTKISKSLIDGDPNKYVFNSGTISRASTLLYATIPKRRGLRSLCQNGGSLDASTGKCICPSGYYKLDCSMNQEVFNAFHDLRIELLDSLISSYESRNPSEPITESYLSSQAFDIYSLVENYDEIDDYIFEKSLYVLENMIEKALQNQEATISSNALSDLLINIVNSFYNYMTYSDKKSEQRIKQLENIVHNISKLILRGKYVGEKAVSFKTQFFTMQTNKAYPSDLSSLLISNGDSSITLPVDMPKYFSNVPSIIPLSYVLLSSPINDFKSGIVQLYQDTTSFGYLKNETTITSKKVIRSQNIGLSFDDHVIENCKNLKYSFELGATIDTSDKLIKTNILNVESVNVTELFYQKSILSCAQYNSNTSIAIIDQDCTLVLNQTVASCLCNRVASYLIVEEVRYRRELLLETSPTSPVVPPIVPPVNSSVVKPPLPTNSNVQQNNNGTIIKYFKYSKSMDGVIVGPILGGAFLIALIGLLAIISWCVYMKKHAKQSNASSIAGIELKTVI